MEATNEAVVVDQLGVTSVAVEAVSAKVISGRQRLVKHAEARLHIPYNGELFFPCRPLAGREQDASGPWHDAWGSGGVPRFHGSASTREV